MEKLFRWLLLLTPVAFYAHYRKMSDIAVFFLAAAAIIPMARYLGEATEELASRRGPAAGGLLNATFGNATEIIIAIFALREGLLEVVKASLTGSIIGNLLLVLGMSMLAGGLKHKKQIFNKTGSNANATMLFLATIALAVPTFLYHSSHNIDHTTTQHLSNTIAILMLLVYIANMVFIFITHKHLYTEEVGKYEAEWSVRRSLLVLAGTTIAIAWLSEALVSSIRPAMSHLGWTDLFMGTVVIAIIGNAAEHYSAISMAIKNRMDLSLQIAVGSAIQIAMFVIPVLLFASLIMGKSMDLVFAPFELAAIFLAVILTNFAVQDGETNWLEGAQLLSAYGIIAVAFFLHP